MKRPNIEMKSAKKSDIILIQKKSICEADFFGFSAIQEFSSRSVLMKAEIESCGAQKWH